jgi:hypothetical protein
MPHPPRTRRDGWTPERQAVFLATLRIPRSVSRAAAAAGLSRESAYAFRLRPGGRLFAAGWERALQQPPIGLTGANREGDKGHSPPSAAPRFNGPKVTAVAPAKVTATALPGRTLPTVNPSRTGRRDAAAGDAFFARLAAAGRTP